MKIFVSFVVGAASGACLGYFLTKRHYESIMEAEIEEVREHYKIKKYVAKNYDTATDTSEEERVIKVHEVSSLEDPEHFAGIPTDEFIEEDEEETMEREEVYESEVEVPVSPREGLSDLPYVISEEQFSTEYLYFDKMSYEYYLGDKTLVDEDGEVKDAEANDILGNDFDGLLEKPDEIVYIRNERMSMDFEIVAVAGNYFSDDEGDDYCEISE